MYPRIAYVTDRGDLPDPDLPLAMAAMERARLAPVAVAWDSDTAWDDFDLVMVRSTWDYVGRRHEFLRWARSVEERTLLANPARILARTTDKTYLRDLALRGVATIETVWFEPGDDVAACTSRLREYGWDRFVVKPNVDGGAVLVDTASDAAEVAAQRAGEGRLALIQPYLPVVEREAELSVVLLGGAISHAVHRRSPLTRDGDDSAAGAVPVPHEVRELLPGIVRAVSDEEPLLYARADLVPFDGRWLLMEFEATEPRLFLDAEPAAADRLAHAVRMAVSPPAQVDGGATG
jgi:hypothetical protein